MKKIELEYFRVLIRVCLVLCKAFGLTYVPRPDRSPDHWPDGTRLTRQINHIILARV